MRLYLVQHGEAKNKEKDPDRSLTDAGIRQTRQIATWLGRLPCTVSAIHHSTKKRAIQTAEIFADRLAPTHGIFTASGLNPNDDVRPIADNLAQSSDPLMIVGHLPFLSRLASLLVSGVPENDVIAFRNSGVVSLVRNSDQWTIEWIIVPELLVDR